MKDVREIISRQATNRQKFLKDNLPPSQQKDIVEVHIGGQNTRISSECYPENLEKRSLIIQDICTMKDVAGIPDELHELQAVEWHDRISDVENEADLCSLKKLSNSNSQLICGLMQQYTYGDSSKVDKYEKLLNKLYFPMNVNYYGNELTDLVVEAGEKCEIGESEKVSVCQFRNVRLGDNARLIYKGIVQLFADDFQQEGDTSSSGNYTSLGTDGGSGGDGGKGGDGAQGAMTQNGSNGQPGADGASGQNGGESAVVTAYIKTISEGTISAYSIGGNGGNGGNGGDGGQGGKGGDGKDEKGYRDGGNGGNGGKGGNGGDGGNAGNGAELFIYCDSPEKITVLYTANKGGNGGNGGKGGDGGQGGNGNGGSSGTTGSSGASGNAGKAGAAGTAGKVSILPYQDPTPEKEG